MRIDIGEIVIVSVQGQVVAGLLVMLIPFSRVSEADLVQPWILVWMIAPGLANFISSEVNHIELLGFFYFVGLISFSCTNK